MRRARPRADPGFWIARFVSIELSRQLSINFSTDWVRDGLDVRISTPLARTRELAAGRQLSSIISVHVCRQLVTDTKSLRAREGRKPIRSALRGRGSGGHWTGFPSPRLLQGGWVGGRLCGEGVGFGGASA